MESNQHWSKFFIPVFVNAARKRSKKSGGTGFQIDLRKEGIDFYAMIYLVGSFEKIMFTHQGWWYTRQDNFFFKYIPQKEQLRIKEEEYYEALISAMNSIGITSPDGMGILIKKHLDVLQHG